jgi:ribose 5-phosphate isomerase A
MTQALIATAAVLSQDELKTLVGQAALQFVVPGEIVGVGTGSTVAYFIDALAPWRDRIAGAVSSSEQSTARLKSHGIEVIDLNAAGPSRCTWTAPTNAIRTSA